MNKAFVLHDKINGKRRVVKVAPVSLAVGSCRQCALFSGDLCEMRVSRSNCFEDRLFGAFFTCGFEDVFYAEDL